MKILTISLPVFFLFISLIATYSLFISFKIKKRIDKINKKKIKNKAKKELQNDIIRRNNSKITNK